MNKGTEGLKNKGLRKAENHAFEVDEVEKRKDEHHRERVYKNQNVMEVLEHSIRENEILEDELPKDDYKDDESLLVLLNSASLYIAKETMFA